MLITNKNNIKGAKRARYSGIKKSLCFMRGCLSSAAMERLNRLIETSYLHIIIIIERIIIYKYKNNLTGFFQRCKIYNFYWFFQDDDLIFDPEGKQPALQAPMIETHQDESLLHRIKRGFFDLFSASSTTTQASPGINFFLIKYKQKKLSLHCCIIL